MLMIYKLIRDYYWKKMINIKMYLQMMRILLIQPKNELMDINKYNNGMILIISLKEQLHLLIILYMSIVILIIYKK